MFKFLKLNDINLKNLENKTEDIFDFIPAVKRHRFCQKFLYFLKYFFAFLFIAIFVLIIFSGNLFVSCFRAYKDASAGRDNLTEAIRLVKEKNFSKAEEFSKKAESNFSLSAGNLEIAKGSFFPSLLPALESQFDDCGYLVKTGEILSRSVAQGAVIGEDLKSFLSGELGLSFSNLSTKQKSKILKLIYENGPELNGLKANLDLAFSNLEKIRFRGLLWFSKNKINKIKDQLGEGKALVSKTIPFVEMLPSLAGYPDKKDFLVLLQNNDELRPTGGFLGTYGILEIKNGDIIRFDTHDIYHLDMPVKDKISVIPPEPIKKYLGVDKWFMRDANWFPDWPTTAEKIAWFYKKENSLLPPQNQINNFSGEFDGFIAITPKLIIDLLEITGPIFINGEEYNKDNFQELLQYKVEADYIQLGIPSWQRKEVIGEIAKELKIKLLDLSFWHWREVINIFSEDILKKDILLFFQDDRLQNLAKEWGWTGEIKETNSDYLMIVDANLAALKTDAVMNKNISYQVEQTVGGLIAKVKINYAHNGKFDWRTTRYRTYTRIYVPEGSRFLRAEGISEGEVETGKEFGKTFFGAFISVEPGKIGSLYFEYKLPANLVELVEKGKYGLYIQKQPGRDTQELVVDLKLQNKIRLYSPTGFYAEKIGENEIKWKTDLNTDKGFEIKF
ncbi:MAG: DUF4012 domain-containing protein [Patescibacteria group bacterium]